MTWTYGINAVELALRDASDTIEMLWLLKSRRPGPARQRIRELATAARVRFKFVTEQELRRELGDVVHQGVAARVQAFGYADPNSLLAVEGDACIVVLDEVQDPHNLGAVMRSAWGFGATGIIIGKHRAAAVTPVARKVAAGAAGQIPVARATNIAAFLKDAKHAGFWVWGADTKDAVEATKVDLSGRVVLVLGSEGKGIRRLVREKCDGAIRIPIQGVESLNVSVAAGVLLYETMRQRRL